jgi:hypothetical protein
VVLQVVEHQTAEAVFVVPLLPVHADDLDAGR